MNGRKILLLWMIVFIGFCAPLHAVEITTGQGVVFKQLDLVFDDGVVSNSSNGQIVIDLLTLRDRTGLNKGYLNVSLNNTWAIKNLAVQTEGEYPYPFIAADFFFDTPVGTDVSQLSAKVSYTASALNSFPAMQAGVFPVTSARVVIGTDGSGIKTRLTTVNDLATILPPAVSDRVSAATTTTSRETVQKDHPNIQAAKNQCMPASVANSLQYLEDTTRLEIPHDNVPGLDFDNSLVGQLEFYMDRDVTSRTEGHGVMEKKAVEGKLKYLLMNGLQDQVRTVYWGSENLFGDAGSGKITQGVNFSGNEVITAAQRGGTDVNFNDIYNQIANGADCELIYDWYQIEGGRLTVKGAHATDVVAAGEKNGQQWIDVISDMDQDSDSSLGSNGGVERLDIRASRNGELEAGRITHMRSIRSVICEYVVPHALPPAVETSVSLIEKQDSGGHEPYTGVLSNAVNISLTDSVSKRVSMAAGSSLPYTLVFDGSNSWYPMTGTLTGSTLSLSSTATVAGIPNVTSTFAGTVSGNTLSGRYTIGANGELYGVPLIYDVSVQAPPGGWPWNNISSGEDDQPADPVIRANGFRRQYVSEEASLPLSVTIEMTSNQDAGENADWWILANVGDLWLHFDLVTGTWQPGIVPTYQGPLFDLPLYRILFLPSGLPSGTNFTAYFGVDLTMDGQPTVNSLAYSYANVSVQ